jgi:hypothetical protein
MRWFNNKRKKLEMLQAIRPTSKATLKIQCLFACKGDSDESRKLYDYFAADMPDLPDYDPVQPSWVDNTKDVANGLFSWFKENQDTLAQGVSFFRDLFGRNAAATEEVVAALPPINE